MDRRAESQYRAKHSFAKSTVSPEVSRAPTRSVHLVLTRTLANERFVFKVMPHNKEIVRSLTDVYNLRDLLCVEFPYFFVS